MLHQHPERATLCAFLEATWSHGNKHPEAKADLERARGHAVEAFLQFCAGLTTYDEFVNFMTTLAFALRK